MSPLAAPLGAGGRGAAGLVEPEPGTGAVSQAAPGFAFSYGKPPSGSGEENGVGLYIADSSALFELGGPCQVFRQEKNLVGCRFCH